EKNEQYKRAESERRRAEANFLKTLEAVDQLLTEVGQKELASLPFLEPVRRRLLEKALGVFEELLKTKSRDATVRFEARLAYRRVADIQRVLGQQQRAKRAFGQAVALLKQLCDEAPAQRSYRQELARAYHGQSVLSLQLGQRREAERACENAHRLQKM